MRILKFIVNGSVIEQDMSYDSGSLVPGSGEEVQAEFIFSNEWSGYAKVAAFWSLLGREYPPQIVKNGVRCTIPREALERRAFKVQVVGYKDGEKIRTNKVKVEQLGGRK